MSVEETETTSKERSKTHHGTPRQPDKVLDIIQCRDKHKLTWQDIGDIYDMTRAGARHLYLRWYDWAKEARQVLSGQKP